MLFNSIEFLIFLPLVFILYWKIGKSYFSQNLIIVLSSCVFYGWWNWKYLLLLTFSITCTYISGLFMERYQLNKSLQKYICGLSILCNLIILFFFKYFNFFIESFSSFLQLLGLQSNMHTLRILLPVGISFYTFQLVSYTIDIYRKQLAATRDYIKFFAYISFFPQLVAGPIERAVHILPQFSRRRTFSYEQSVDGLRQMLWGFCKKILVADNCAVAVNMIFSDYQSLSGSDLFLGAFLFAFQIYGDFSGYSDIAIGCAKLFGVELMRNFSLPYFAHNIAEFWRRWHISLTTWFTDYLYIPLGGSRCSLAINIRNIFIVFLVSGLWHGANWTFIFWGVYHALLFIPLRLLEKYRKSRQDLIPTSSNHIKKCLQITVTFLLVMIGWIIFRADSLSQAFEYIYLMVSSMELSFPAHGKTALLFILMMLVAEWCQQEKKHPFEFGNRGIFRFRLCRYLLYYTVIITLMNFSAEQKTFIYFNF